MIAEGLAERIAPEELAAVSTATRDAYGHVRLADVPLGMVLRDAVRARLKELGIKTRPSSPRTSATSCAAPSRSRSTSSTRARWATARCATCSAAAAARSSRSRGGRIAPVTLEEMLDPATGRIRVRLVDVTTESYEVARKYMIRLEEADLSEPRLSRLAAQTNLDPDVFGARFRRLFPPPAAA